MAGCTYFQPKDEPPPLPPIEETKPPLKLHGSQFKSFPWDELPKPLKDGNDPDTFVYTVKKGETLKDVAEKNMGDPSLAAGLASYNGLSSPDVSEGEKIVIPDPIIGVVARILVKRKGAKEFSGPKPFNTEMSKGDEYRLSFETNVNGYLYIFRKGPKETTMLFPARPARKPGRRGRRSPSPPRVAKVTAHEPVLIPTGKTGFKFDSKRAGDQIFVFLSLRRIPELEDLKEKKKIAKEEIQDVMHRIKIGDIYSDDPPYTLLRIEDPTEILGFSLTLKG
jgi:LysM repeat protein